MLVKLPRGYNVQYSNDGTLLVCLGRFVVIHDVSKRQRVKNAHPFPHPSTASFSPDDSMLVVKSTSGRIVVLNPRSGDILFDHKDQREDEGSNVLFSPTGQQLVDGSWGGVLRVRNALRDEILEGFIFKKEMVRRISVSDDHQVWVTEHSPKWDADAGRAGPSYALIWRWPWVEAKTRRIELPIGIESVGISPNGRTLCCLAGLYPVQHILLIRIADGKIIARSADFEAGGTGKWLGWSRDGEIIASVQKGRFAFYRATNLDLLGVFATNYPSCVAFRPGTDEIALGSWDQTIVMKLDEILKSQRA